MTQTEFRAAREREQRANVEPIDVLKRPLQRDLVETVAPILSRLVGASRGPDGDVADALHLTPADVAAMRQDGLTIGGHGRRHVWFDHEISGSCRGRGRGERTFLASEPAPWAFAYPYGASSPAALDALPSNGFSAAFHAVASRLERCL